MKTRIIAGLVAAAVVLTLVFMAPIFFVLVFVLLCTVLCYLEYDHLFFDTPSLLRKLGMIFLLCLNVYFLYANFSFGVFTLLFSFVSIAIVEMARLHRSSDLKVFLRNTTLLWMGIGYLVSILGFLVPIINYSEEGRRYIFLFLLIVFLGDTTAYFIGSKFGKNKLSPAVSPKKSVEGAVGSLVSSFVAVTLWFYFFAPENSNNSLFVKIILLAPLLSVLGILGDLFESALKRSCSVKDSGSFLPGHGGILDRIDGFVFTAPVFYFFIKVVVGEF